jgi:CMP/dCMP kinase
MKKGYVITIDGPAGAGKSTVGKALSKRLAYSYLDTGALYRAVAYEMIKENISPNHQDELADICSRIKINLKNIENHMRVFLDNEDVTDKIRTEDIGLLASKASAIPLVRNTLFGVQREAGKRGRIVAEGRDMGTVIFPDADVKFFLDASVDERALRRCKELAMRKNCIDFQEIRRDLIQRDRQDREREIAPLIPSEDAVVIDSTNMTISNVVKEMISIIKCKL